MTLLIYTHTKANRATLPGNALDKDLNAEGIQAGMARATNTLYLVCLSSDGYPPTLGFWKEMLRKMTQGQKVRLVMILESDDPMLSTFKHSSWKSGFPGQEIFPNDDENHRWVMEVDAWKVRKVLTGTGTPLYQKLSEVWAWQIEDRGVQGEGARTARKRSSTKGRNKAYVEKDKTPFMDEEDEAMEEEDVEVIDGRAADDEDDNVEEDNDDGDDEDDDNNKEEEGDDDENEDEDEVVVEEDDDSEDELAR